LNTLKRRWPFDNTDINRMSPGYGAGETTQRIAQAVLDVTSPDHYRVDLHSAALDFEELPQVRGFMTPPMMNASWRVCLACRR
jgi:predicted deacylase